MIINYSDNCFSIAYEREDWYYYSTYTLQNFIKSIPKSYRRFDWNSKEWIIDNKYISLLDTIHFYTKEEELEGQIALDNFINLLYQP